VRDTCIIDAGTVTGNVMVLLAIKRESSLQTLFNYYIVNLAVTDLGVAVTAMSFYTVDVVLGYCPFGDVMCGVWIFCDYGMTFASVFTLIVISLDRFWVGHVGRPLPQSQLQAEVSAVHIIRVVSELGCVVGDV
jgi:hypothetical protein